MARLNLKLNSQTENEYDCRILKILLFSSHNEK